LEKFDNLTKDLDDLVSLYEIVSEQMNPFVGLSKVTKKRIDALENYTREIELIKDRVGNLESGLESGNFNPIELNEEKISAISKEKEPEEQTSIKEPSEEIEAKEQTYNELQDFNEDFKNLTEEDIDNILNDTFSSILIEENINGIIDEFFLNLK